MKESMLAVIIIAVVLIALASYKPLAGWLDRRARRLREAESKFTDQHLAELLAFFERIIYVKRRPGSKPFPALPNGQAERSSDARIHITTERLSDEEYREIREQCFDPDMLSKYGEELTSLNNRYSAQGIKREQNRRREPGGKDLSAEQLDFLAAEDLRLTEAPRASNPFPTELPIDYERINAPIEAREDRHV